MINLIYCKNEKEMKTKWKKISVDEQDKQKACGHNKGYNDIFG